MGVVISVIGFLLLFMFESMERRDDEIFGVFTFMLGVVDSSTGCCQVSIRWVYWARNNAGRPEEYSLRSRTVDHRPVWAHLWHFPAKPVVGQNHGLRPLPAMTRDLDHTTLKYSQTSQLLQALAAMTRDPDQTPLQHYSSRNIPGNRSDWCPRLRVTLGRGPPLASAAPKHSVLICWSWYGLLPSYYWPTVVRLRPSIIMATSPQDLRLRDTESDCQLPAEIFHRLWSYVSWKGESENTFPNLGAISGVISLRPPQSPQQNKFWRLLSPSSFTLVDLRCELGHWTRSCPYYVTGV